MIEPSDQPPYTDKRPVEELTFCGDLMSREERLMRAQRDDARANLRGATYQLEKLRAAYAAAQERRDKLHDAGEDLDDAQAALEDVAKHVTAWENTQAAHEEEVAAMTEKIDAWEAERKPESAKVLALLRAANVATAQEIMDLGCTGLYGRFLANKVVPPDEIVSTLSTLLRHLEGSGVGMVCYVDIGHFCNVHNVIGGLEEGQEVAHAENLPAIQRELTPEEKGRVALIEHARRQPGETAQARMLNAKGLLEGTNIPKDAPIVDWPGNNDSPMPAAEAGTVEDNQRLQLEKVNETLRGIGLDDLPNPWECPEHKSTVWACRFCLAQALVAGDLEPTLLIEVDHSSKGGAHQDVSTVAPADVDERISGADTPRVRLFACVASWTRKLSRD